MVQSQFRILVLVSLSLISCASPREHYDPGLDASVPQVRTKYSTIVEAFDRANRAPDVNDFDLLDEFHPKTHCYLTRASTPEVLSEVVIRQMSVTYSGTPSYGPLFPGDPDRIETILVLGKDTAWVNSTNLTNEKRQVFELHPMGSTLVIKINENQFGIYQDFGNPAEIWLRKSTDGNIFFNVFKVDAEHNRNEASVGYCFKK